MPFSIASSSDALTTTRVSAQTAEPRASVRRQLRLDVGEPPPRQRVRLQEHLLGERPVGGRALGVRRVPPARRT